MEMGGATGNIYSGDPGVDRAHLISSYHTTNYTIYHSGLVVWLALSEISWILTTGSYHIFSPSSYALRARTALSHKFLLEWRKRCSGVLMMGSLPSSASISPDGHPPPAIHNQPSTSQCLQWSKSLKHACKSIRGCNSEVRLEIFSHLRV